MCKLVLNVGDFVRNINPDSGRKGQVGQVVSKATTNHFCQYGVLYAGNKEPTYYGVATAHRYLEKLVTECPCQQSFFKVDLHGSDADVTMIDIKRATGSGGISYVQPAEPERRVLKKVRRNVLNGKTQDDYVRDMGHARGVEQFNTRALGKSTGQALHAIGSAMMNPGTEIRISKVDHAREKPGCSTSWTTLDKHFRLLVQSLLGDMKGFTFTDTHIVFNPIVTEETYVEL